jgi:hypothetical protein
VELKNRGNPISPFGKFRVLFHRMISTRLRKASVQANPKMQLSQREADYSVVDWIHQTNFMDWRTIEGMTEANFHVFFGEKFLLQVANAIYKLDDCNVDIRNFFVPCLLLLFVNCQKYVSVIIIIVVG